MLILKLIENRLHHFIVPIDIVASHDGLSKVIVSHIENAGQNQTEKQRVVGIIPKEEIPAFIAEIQAQIVLFRHYAFGLQIPRHQSFNVHHDNYLWNPMRVLVE